MAKVICIIILILIAIRGILKSTARHKIGYVLIAVWSLPLFFDSLGQKLSAYFENHELAAEIYHGPLILFLLVYGAVGILEGLIRRRDGEFTFLRLLIGRKRRTDIIEEEYDSAEKISFKPEEPKGSKEELSPAKVIYPDKNSSLDRILSELNQMIGLNSVKKEIAELIQMEKFQQQRKKQGLKRSDAGSYHLVFAGNPGTGKTTVARMVAGIYYHLGIVSGGQLIEVDRSGLVGEYLGQTALKTSEVIKKAIGGVLFIDEAYSLIHEGSGKGDTFGKEALDTLLKAMEDYREDLVIIMAGYTEEMEEFISVNPGLKSRFKKTVHFEDYNPQELLEIFCSYAQKDENVILPEAQTELAHAFTVMYGQRDRKFGNGRSVRNLYNAILQQLGVRVSMLKSPSKSDLQTITTADVRAAAEMEFGTAETETKSLHLPDYCRMFALRQSYWDHGIEWEVYSALRQFISDDYIVIPHEAFSNLFYWKWEDDWKLTDRVTKAHFDFVIYNNNFMPIVLIEVNGSTHKSSPNRMEMDEFKRKLAAEKGVKLISLDATKTIGNIQQEVEERIRHEFPDRDSCPTYCPTCHSRIRMILQRNKSTNEYFYRCVNKECGTTHSLGRSGDYRKIAPLYKNMPYKLF